MNLHSNDYFNNIIYVLISLLFFLFCAWSGFNIWEPGTMFLPMKTYFLLISTIKLIRLQLILKPGLFRKCSYCSQSWDGVPFPVLQVEELKAHHGWLLNTLTFFKSPNEVSKNALSSSRIDVGSHSLEIKPELRDIALQVSTHLVCPSSAKTNCMQWLLLFKLATCMYDYFCCWYQKL